MTRAKTVLLWSAALAAMTGCATMQPVSQPGAQLVEAARTGDLATLKAQLASQDPNAPGPVCPTRQRGNALMAAAEAGNTQAVRLLLAAGADPNRQVAKVMQWPCNHYTALIFAAKGGHADIVKLLLASGADPELRGGRMAGRTAAEWARQEGRADIAELIAIAAALSPEQRRAKFGPPPQAAAAAPAPAAAAPAAPPSSPAPAEPESAAAPSAAPAPAPAPEPAPEPQRKLTPAERKALESQL